MVDMYPVASEQLHSRAFRPEVTNPVAEAAISQQDHGLIAPEMLESLLGQPISSAHRASLWVYHVKSREWKVYAFPQADVQVCVHDVESKLQSINSECCDAYVSIIVWDDGLDVIYHCADNLYYNRFDLTTEQWEK
jgi:hypothetical protein